MSLSTRPFVRHFAFCFSQHVSWFFLYSHFPREHSRVCEHVYSSTSGRTRHRSTAAFRMKAIEFAEENQNMAAQCLREGERYWRSQKDKLPAGNSWNTSSCKHHTMPRELANKVVDFFQEARTQSLFPTEATHYDAVQLMHQDSYGSLRV